MTTAPPAQSRPSRLSLFGYDRSRAGRGPLALGLWVLIPIFLIFLLWSLLAPLNSAAIASGEIVLSASRKTIQHLEGGLVTRVYVAEGQSVTAGEPLVELQDLAERARKAALAVELVNTNAQLARLVAERDGLAAPDFGSIAEGISLDPASIARFARIHAGVFETLTAAEKSAQELANSRKTQIRREIEGLQAQLSAKTQEAKLLTADLVAKRASLQRGFSTEAEVNALARAAAVLEGEVGALIAAVAKSEQAILDQDVEILQMRNDRITAMLQELQQAQVTAESGRQELRMLQDRQDRAMIRAPVDGVVLGLQVHTVGAVISPGLPLMDIVPNEDVLVIEARVNPTDIDLVAPGMAAEVQLSAFKAARLDKLAARVETVSADILTDQTTGERYFLVRLNVDKEALAALPPGVNLGPGMPATVFLIAGERTLAQYLLSPLLQATDRAFRED